MNKICRLTSEHAVPDKSSIILFGGSFDPPHNAHVALCNWVCDTYPFEQLLIVPCGSHPFNKSLSSYEHRRNMLDLAFPEVSRMRRGVQKIFISDIEATYEGKSYTIDTVETIRKTVPHANIWLLCGNDIIEQIDSWHRSKDLLAQVQLLCYPSKRRLSAKNSSGDDVSAISSTDLRDRIKREKDIKDIVPSAVADYIRAHRLYLV